MILPEDAKTNDASNATTESNVVKLPEPASGLKDSRGIRFVKEHPVMTVAGGLVIGALAAALIPRRNRAYVTKRTSALADAVTSASLAIASQALERAEAAGSEASDTAHRLANRANRMGNRLASSAYDLLPYSKPKTFRGKLAAKARKAKSRMYG